MSSALLPSATDAEEWARTLEQCSRTPENVGETVSQKCCDATQKVDDLAARAGTNLLELGEKLEKKAPQAGALGNASRTIVETMKDSGEYLEDAKFTGMIDDVGKMIRRNPIPAICLAIGFGWFLGHKQR